MTWDETDFPWFIPNLFLKKFTIDCFPFYHRFQLASAFEVLHENDDEEYEWAYYSFN